MTKVTAEVFWSRVDIRSEDECWPWLGHQASGRGRVVFEGRSQMAYRVAWQLVHGEPISADLCACHKCDNPICVNPGHIFTGTMKDNMQDARAKGRLAQVGLGHHAAAVPPDLVARAVAEYLNGSERQVDVAARYGVSATTLGGWVRGEWRQDAGIVPGARALKPCGTYAAYMRHWRRGEQACDACLAANAERTAMRNAAARERAAA